MHMVAWVCGRVVGAVAAGDAGKAQRELSDARKGPNEGKHRSSVGGAFEGLKRAERLSFRLFVRQVGHAGLQAFMLDAMFDRVNVVVVVVVFGNVLLQCRQPWPQRIPHTLAPHASPHPE